MSPSITPEFDSPQPAPAGASARSAGNWRTSLGVMAAVALLKSAYQVGGLWVWSDAPVAIKSGISLASLAADFLALVPIWWLMQKRYQRAVPQGWKLGLTWWALVLAQATVCSIAHFLIPIGLFEGTDLRLDFVNMWRWNVVVAMGSVTVMHHIIRDQIAVAAAQEAQLAQLAALREQDAAQMQLLQAQMEPHFLFNALANVRRLIRTEPSAARELLGDLSRYVQAALPKLRQAHTTLAEEAKLVESFLSIHQVRMASRLRFRVDVDPSLSGVAVPSMGVLTLVENALKHGIGPLVEGGSVEVAAYTVQEAQNAYAVIEVADTGRGMAAGGGSGSGLLNVRERLKALHGNAAHLSLSVNEPRGVVARMKWPLANDGAQT